MDVSNVSSSGACGLEQNFMNNPTVRAKTSVAEIAKIEYHKILLLESSFGILLSE